MLLQSLAFLYSTFVPTCQVLSHYKKGQASITIDLWCKNVSISCNPITNFLLCSHIISCVYSHLESITFTFVWQKQKTASFPESSHSWFLHWEVYWLVQPWQLLLQWLNLQIMITGGEQEARESLTKCLRRTTKVALYHLSFLLQSGC